jgi:hypothetical protein
MGSMALTRRCLGLLVVIASTVGCPACPANWPFPPDTWNTIPCSTYRDEVRPVHIEARFVDARQVALSAQDGRPLAAAGGGATDVPFATGVQSTGAFSSGTYAIRARREADGALVLVWTSDMPLPKGARQILVTADGAIDNLYMNADALAHSGMLQRDVLELRLCITAGTARYGGIVPLSQPDTFEHSCASMARLRTPWSNVAFVREVTAPTQDFTGTRSLATEACHLPPPQPESVRLLFAGGGAPPQIGASDSPRASLDANGSAR